MSSQAHENELSGANSQEFLGASGLTKRKTFYSESTPTRWSRSRVVDVKHIKLDIAVDLEGKSIRGTSSLTFSAITEDVTSITLDAMDMEIGTLESDAGIPLSHNYDGERLRIDFSGALPYDKDITLKIPYSVSTPKAGAYFIAPDEFYPNKKVEMWTQGQDEDSRFWYPCFDYPNERLTSEIRVTVPARFNTLSNGALLSETDNGDGSKTWHWKHDVPHVTYLVMLAVGEWILVEDEWDGIPVNYYAYEEDLSRAKNSFGQTPDMVRYFSEKIGVRYPYAKYAQVAATDFIFGGMENTTATVQTDQTLHDDRAHLDFSSNPLVSHELAHQWFGDLITMRDWSHAWLNEGFTTYMECCWTQEEHGDEEFQWYMLHEMENYLAEDKSNYRRAIVCNRYDEPIDLFDRHLYEKGACVQHMLRSILGERLFWKALKHYTEKHAGGYAITQDWQTAIEEATGRNLDEFFNQWIYGGGHPEFKLSFSYDKDKLLASLTISQTQEADNLTVECYKVPITIRFVKIGDDASAHETCVELAQRDQKLHLPLDFEPDFVTFDVGNWITKTLDLSSISEGMLTKQVGHDLDVIARVHAARELGKRSTRRACVALIETMKAEAPWFVHAECAKALGSIGTPTALGGLLESLNIEHPKARRAIVAALGEFREPAAASALLSILEKDDPSYHVYAEACHSLGKTRDERAFDALTKAATYEKSFNDVIPTGALDGLLQLENSRSVDAMKACAARGNSNRLRLNALMRIGKLGRLLDEREQHDVRRFLEDTLDETAFFPSIGAIGGLGALANTAAIPALRRKLNHAVDGRIQSRCRKVIEALAGKSTSDQQASKLRDELGELKKQNAKLADRLDRLEAVASSSNG